MVSVRNGVVCVVDGVDRHLSARTPGLCHVSRGGRSDARFGNQRTRALLEWATLRVDGKVHSVGNRIQIAGH